MYIGLLSGASEYIILLIFENRLIATKCNDIDGQRGYIERTIKLHIFIRFRRNINQSTCVVCASLKVHNLYCGPVQVCSVPPNKHMQHVHWLN